MASAADERPSVTRTPWSAPAPPAEPWGFGAGSKAAARPKTYYSAYLSHSTWN